jgi:branched-chain amino acid transport system ATP-binding protein
VSLEVPAGEIVAVLGANGAGKTSLLRTISGLIHPRRGRVLLEDEDITKAATEDLVRRGVAYVPEGGGAIGELTVEENLRLGGLWRRDRRERTRMFDEVVAIFPRLGERIGVHASNLSGGERQMLSIGRALMGRPRMLLLDEPSLGLAPIVVTEIMGVIGRLRRERGVTVLLVEQNASSALSVANRGFVLNVGRVVVAAEAATLAADEKLRHAYLGLA